MNPDALVRYGHEVKALPGGVVGGYLVRFTDETSPDLAGDFFTKDTNFGLLGEAALCWYGHGQDATLGKKSFGTASLKVDDVGIWAETQLNLRDAYEAAIYGMAKKGLMGWSSGAPAHLVEREAKSDGVYWIKTWPLMCDASLTPIPCEPRNSAMPIKSVTLPQIEVETKSKGLSASDKMDLLKGAITAKFSGSWGYFYICDLYDASVIVNVYGLDEDGYTDWDSPSVRYEVPYTISAGNVVTIGDPVVVVRKTVYEAVAAKDVTFANQSEFVLAAAQDYLQRAEAYRDLKARDRRDPAPARIRELKAIGQKLLALTEPPVPVDVMGALAANEIALSQRR